MSNVWKAMSRLRRLLLRIDPFIVIEALLWLGWWIIGGMLVLAVTLIIYPGIYRTIQTAMILPVALSCGLMLLGYGLRALKRKILLSTKYGGVRYRAECLSAWLVAGELRTISFDGPFVNNPRLVVQSKADKYRFVREYVWNGEVRDEGRITPQIQSLFLGYMNSASDMRRLLKRLEADPKLDITHDHFETIVKRRKNIATLAAKAG